MRIKRAVVAVIVRRQAVFVLISAARGIIGATAGPSRSFGAGGRMGGQNLHEMTLLGL
jgi:hypothetical protein